MYICNISFWCEPAALEERLSLLRGEVMPLLSPGAGAMQLGELVEGADMPSLAGHPATISLRLEFPQRSDFDSWWADVCLPVLNDYRARYGEEGLCMATLLKTL